MDPIGGGPAYADGDPRQEQNGGGGICASCGRDLPPPDLESVAASIDQTLSMEAGRMVPRTAWAGRPPDGAMDALLFWLPSVKSNRKLWERGQALWTEQMTAALSGPCVECLGGVPQPPPTPGQSPMQTPESAPAVQASTAYLPYEPNPPANVPSSGLPPTAYLPYSPDDDVDAATSAVPAYSDYGKPPASPVEDAPTSAVPSFSSGVGGPKPADSPVPPPPPVPESDEHESHTVIFSPMSMPSVRTATRLVVLEGPVRGRQFSLGRDRTTIGRSIGCHVTVEADAVSYDHATVVRAGDIWQIELSGTASELYVNDEAVHGSRTLKPGDVIGIGPARLRFESVS